MSLNIKNERVHELAREAAILSGGTQTSALQDALEDYVTRLRQEHQQTGAADDDRIDDLLRSIRGRIRADGPLSTEELYDEEGLPA